MTDAEVDRRIARLESDRLKYQRDTLNSWMSCAELETMSHEAGEMCRESMARSSERDGDFMRSIQRQIDKLDAQRP